MREMAAAVEAVAVERLFRFARVATIESYQPRLAVGNWQGRWLDADPLGLDGFARIHAS
jgi:hypothetical protein